MYKCWLIGLFGILNSGVQAQGLSGMSGLFHIPVAGMSEDRTLFVGAHFMDREYGGYKFYDDPGYDWDALGTFATLVFLPRLEVQFRYTHLLGRRSSFDTKYFPDRMASVRLQVLREGDKWPALTIGVQDIARQIGFTSSSYYAANYVVCSKTEVLGRFRIAGSLGYGGQLRRVDRLQLDGLFGGVAIGMSRFAGTDFLAEYDSRHWNIAGRVLLFNRLQVLAGWYALKTFSGGISWKWVL